MDSHRPSKQRCGWFGEGRGQCLFLEGHRGHHTCEEDGRLLTERGAHETNEWHCTHCGCPNAATVTLNVTHCQKCERIKQPAEKASTDWHMDSCKLKYGGVRCTCGLTNG